MIFERKIPLMDAKGGGGGAYKPKELTIKEKKEQIKNLLNGDIELLNEIIVELRKEKINKIKN